MEEIKIPVARDLRNERCDGLLHLMMPRHEDEQYTSYLEARKLVLDVTGLKDEEKLPSIQEMLDKWRPLEER